VQDPLEAEYDGMPQSALSTGVIDLVLPLSDMIPHVLKFLATKPRLYVPSDDNEDARPALSKTLAIIRNQLGSDFSRYKQSTIMRRIQRRMQLSHIEEIKDYLNLLNTDSNEVTALANDFLINVTSFFRDQSVFDEIEQKNNSGIIQRQMCYRFCARLVGWLCVRRRGVFARDTAT
jgi:two-component system CheB/CheR fusion protein